MEQTSETPDPAVGVERRVMPRCADCRDEAPSLDLYDDEWLCDECAEWRYRMETTCPECDGAGFTEHELDAYHPRPCMACGGQREKAYH